MTQAPILILQASKQPYLSVGIYCGGIKAYGYEYYYMPPHDAYLRKDWVKKFNKHKKEGGDWNGFVEIVKCS